MRPDPPTSDPLPTGTPIGRRVRVRRQPWTIVDARQYDQCRLLTLAGAGALNAGLRRSFLAPFDRVEPIERPRTPKHASWRAWRALCRAALARHGIAGSLFSASRAPIALLPHQLEPALALLRGRGSRVLIADEVGLGKTVQAGLALAALRRTGLVERALVLTPAGLRDQWCEELARHALEPSVVDARAMKQRSAEVALGASPWITTAIAVSSFDYVKQPAVLPFALSAPWDVVIVDEAHGVTPSSDRWHAVHTLCRLAHYVVLLTATPHSGDERAFVSLCALGAAGDDLLLFRRTRHEVQIATERRVHRLFVRPTRQEWRMHALLARLARAVRERRDPGAADARLALTVLQKRAWSGPHALERSVSRRLALLRANDAPTEAQLLLPLEPDDPGEFDADDAPPIIRAPLLADVPQEADHLRRLADAARLAERHDSKRAAVVRFVRRLGRRSESVIVFTEYRDTLVHLSSAFAGECVVLHGGMTRTERRAATTAFTTGAQRLLLATDAAGEGLNLQAACRTVINLELPWNPVRLEQRVGRVDRIGQRRRVHATHLVARGTAEVRVLRRLDARLARACAAVEPHASRKTPGVRLVRLAEEAAAEHARLVVERRMLDRHLSRAERETLRPLVSRRRRRRDGDFPRGQALAVLETVCDDGLGRRVAAHLTPLVAAPPDVALDAWMHLVESLPWDDLDPSLSAWREATTTACRDFWGERIRRARAILEAMGRSPGGILQPGLFDRRAERSHDLLTHEHERLRAAEAASAMSIHPPRLQLLLLPVNGPFSRS